MVATSHCWNLPHPPSSTFSSFRSSWVLSFSQCLLETFQKFQDSSTNLLSALQGVKPKARKAWFISWRCLQIPGPHKKWWKWTLLSLVWVKTFKHGCWSFHGTFCSPGFTMCSKYSYQKKVCKANESFRRGVLGWPGMLGKAAMMSQLSWKRLILSVPCPWKISKFHWTQAAQAYFQKISKQAGGDMWMDI